MKLQVKYFAAARERTGVLSEEHVLAKGATVAELKTALIAAHPSLEALLPHLRIAVDQEFASDDTALSDGAEVALIPPVAGGAGEPSFRVLDRPLSVEDVMRAVSGAGQGGLVTFTGIVRNQTRGKAVQRLEYEAYEPMAVKTFERIALECEGKWPGVRLAVDHRVGTLTPGETAVVIAASAPHRAEAFAACSFALERLKADAPIWKREVYADGAVWVGLGP